MNVTHGARIGLGLALAAALAGACHKASSTPGACNPGPEDFAPCAQQGVICNLGNECVAPKYTVNGDGTVTDQVTGLIWQQVLAFDPCPQDADAGAYIDAGPAVDAGPPIDAGPPYPGEDAGIYGCFWPDAQGYCESLSLGGKSGWRLPTVAELFSLGDMSPASGIDVAAFPNIGTNFLWTSQTISGLTGDAWSITFVPYVPGVGGGPDVVAQTYTMTPQVNDTLEFALCVHSPD